MNILNECLRVLIDCSHKTYYNSPKPITMCCSVLSPEIVVHDGAYIGRRSENNIKCVVHDDLWWKNRTTWYILPRHWLYEWFSQFHKCGNYSVLWRSPSIVLALLLHLVRMWFHVTVKRRKIFLSAKPNLYLYRSCRTVWCIVDSLMVCCCGISVQNAFDALSADWYVKPPWCIMLVLMFCFNDKWHGTVVLRVNLLDRREILEGTWGITN